MSSFSEGLAPVCLKDSTDSALREYGFINAEGEVVYRGFQKAESFSEGLAAVALPVPYEKFDDKRFGYIDKNGDWVLEPKYGEASEFSGGAASVTIGGSRDMMPHHLIDRNGEFITEKEFDSCTRNTLPGVFSVTAFDDHQSRYLINTKGEEVFPGYY